MAARAGCSREKIAMRITTLILIAAGGAGGAVARYLISTACCSLWGDRFGIGTLVVNIAGCFLLGMIAHGGIATGLRQPWLTHPGITAGLLGGLTTFSTFGYETFKHLEDGERGLALLNVSANLGVGMLAVFAGVAISRTVMAS